MIDNISRGGIDPPRTFFIKIYRCCCAVSFACVRYRQFCSFVRLSCSGRGVAFAIIYAAVVSAIRNAFGSWYIYNAFLLLPYSDRCVDSSVRRIDGIDNKKGFFALLKNLFGRLFL